MSFYSSSSFGSTKIWMNWLCAWIISNSIRFPSQKTHILPLNPSASTLNQFGIPIFLHTSSATLPLIRGSNNARIVNRYRFFGSYGFLMNLLLPAPLQFLKRIELMFILIDQEIGVEVPSSTASATRQPISPFPSRRDVYRCLSLPHRSPHLTPPRWSFVRNVWGLGHFEDHPW